MDELTTRGLESGDLLPLMESFYSIQGEGYHAGKAAYFLRIGGCDVGCHWCDVKESWDSSMYAPIPVTDILKETEKFEVDTVVITGGEPLMWNLDKLTRGLKYQEKKVHLETSGAYPLSGIFDWICLSPKKNQHPTKEIKSFVDELKIIVSNKHDLIWAEEQREGLNNVSKLYLQPEWSKKELVIPMIVDYVQEHKEWLVSLQTHKYMNIP